MAFVEYTGEIAPVEKPTVTPTFTPYTGEVSPAVKPSETPSLLAGTTLSPEAPPMGNRMISEVGVEPLPITRELPKADVSKMPTAEDRAVSQFGITPEMGFGEKALRTAKGSLYGASTGLEQTWMGGARMISDITGLGKEGVEGASKQLSKEQAAVEQTYAPEYGFKIAKDIGASVVQNLPTIGVGLYSGTAGALTSMFSQSFMQTYDDSRNEGLGVGASTARSALYGTAEALGESIGLPNLLKGAKAALKGVPTAELAKDLATYMVKEIPGEQLTYIAQFLTDKGFDMNPQAGLTEFLQGMQDTALVTLGQTAVMGGTGLATNKILKDLRQYHSEGEAGIPSTAPAEKEEAPKAPKLAEYKGDVEPITAVTPVIPEAKVTVEAAPAELANAEPIPMTEDEQYRADMLAELESTPPAEATKTPVERAVEPEIAAPVEQAPEAEQIIQNRNRATPASINQMNQIAGAPDYDRISFSKDFSNGAPVVAGNLELAPEQLGTESVVTSADGRKIPVQYGVVESDEILPSNNADGSVNKEFLDPSYAGFKAIAGNARTAGIQAAYERGTADQYKASMIEDNLHGIDPSVIEGMVKPVLVRIMPQDQVTNDIGDISNVATNLTLSAVEQAKNDANRVDLQGLAFDDNGNVTMSALRGFIQAMPTSEQASLIDTTGLPTKQAVDRLNAAIFSKAYENEELVRLSHQAEDAEAKLVLKALSEVAPQMSRLEGAGEYDIRPQVAQAAELAVNARRNGIKLDSLVKQQDMTVDPLAQHILQIMADNARSGKRMAEALRDLADRAYQESQGGAVDMFGEKPKRTVTELAQERPAPEVDIFGEKTPRMELPSDQFVKEGEKIVSDMRTALDKMGLQDVGLKFEDQMFRYLDGKLTEVNGTYFNNLIEISLASTDINRTLNHEALHAMKDLGLFTKSNWNILEKKAKSTWMKQYNIAKDYSHESSEIQVEEAIAHAFADNNSQQSIIKAIFKKIVNFISSFKNALSGNGFKSYESVLKAAKEGKLKGKEKVTQKTERAEIKKPTTIHKNYKGGPAPLASWNSPEVTQKESLIDSFLYKMQDKFIDTKRVQQAITQQVGEIEDRFNAYNKESLMHEKTAKQTQDFLKNELLPIIKDMQKNDITIQEFGGDKGYLHNRHAIERNEQIATINPELQDEGSGIKTADAEKYMANLDPAKKEVMEKLAKKVDDIIKETQRILVDSGLETQETINAWNKTYKHYMPLFRENLDFATTKKGKGTGVGTRGPSTRRALGSTKEISEILSNVAEFRESAIMRAERAVVGRAIYGLAIKYPNTDYWLAVNPDAVKNKKKLEAELVAHGMSLEDAKSFIQEPQQAYIDPKTGLVAYRVNPVLRNSDNVLPVRVNGKDRYVFFNPNNEQAMRMVGALKNLDTKGFNSFFNMIGKGTRWLASVNTQYNPVFGIWNFVRDVQGAALNVTSTELAGHEKAIMKDTLPALKGIYQDIRSQSKGEGPADTEWANLWEDFQQAGGPTGYKDQFSKARREATIIEREMKNLNHGNAMKVAKSVAQWLSDYNDSMENAVRLSAYKVALDNGMSKDKAAILAKNITVNFNRKGALAQDIGVLYAFFNASVQGSARLVETLKGPAGRKIVAGGLLIGTMQAIALAMAGFDDDDPPEFVKARNLIIPTGDGTYVMIPMPLGYNIIPTAGRIFTEIVISGGKKAPTKIFDLMSAFADAFNPIGGSGLQLIAPTVLDPFVALKTNKDAFGRPIFREDRETAPTPGYMRSRESASTFSKYLSEFLNYVSSGGMKYTKGAVSPTADEIDYLAGQVTGGIGREVMKAGQTIGNLFTGEETAPYKRPIISKLVGDTEAPSNIANKFYQNIIDMANHESEVKGRRKNHEDVTGYLQDNPEARLWQRANNVENQINKLNKEKRDLAKKEDQEDRIKRIDEKKTKLMKDFNDQVRAAQE
jgi:hypothetical protein